MGRPLNKKYFGNRNIGTTTTADNGIGGEGVASVTIGGTNNAYVAVPSVTFADPTLPGSVTATGSAVMGVVGVTLVAAGTGYAVNDVITLAAGAGAGTAATLTVTAITGGGATGPIDTVSITTAGNYTTITDVTAVGVTGPGNDDATFDLTFKVNSITITEKGSGYVSAPSITMSGNATKTAVLTTDSGAAGSSTNQENAIVAYAYIPESGQAGYISGAGGSSSVIADIQKQSNDRRYKVKTAQGVGLCQLVAAAPAAGQMNIIATDANGNTYYVTKLTARKAVLTRKVDDGSDDDWVYATGATAPWTFAAPTGAYVQIENA